MVLWFNGFKAVFVYSLSQKFHSKDREMYIYIFDIVLKWLGLLTPIDCIVTE